jgi:O-succinylbenzoic acid--CoA ligase
VIEWLLRVDPERPFLRVGDRCWTYGDAVVEVEQRVTADYLVLGPDLEATSVFQVMAGLSGGGLTVGGPGGWVGPKPPADLVVFTSGTTGLPKGVRLTRANLEAAARASMAHLGHDADDDWLLAIPLHHVGGLSILVRQAYAGGSVTLQSGFDPISFASAMHGGVTLVSVVPTMLRRIVEYGPFSGLRAVLVGGGPIPDGLLEEATAAGLPVLPTYGMTETFGQIATLRPGSPVERKAHPLPGVDISIGQDGRIAVRGDQVSPGYLGEPDRLDPWFVTNDLGTIDADGALRVVGRSDNVIITGGENVHPEQVEEAFRRHPQVDEICVIGVDDAEWGQRLVGVFEGDVEPEELIRWAHGLLPSHMVPKELRRVSSVPTISIGKPDRRVVMASGFDSDG